MKPPLESPLERISLRSIGGYILESLNLERGLGYTVRKLVVDPQGAIREFLFEDRRRMVKPLTLLLLLAGIAAFMSFHFLNLEAELSNASGTAPALPGLPQFSEELILRMTGFLKQYFNLVLISSIPFLALASFLIFRSDGLNYAEHLVINTYIYCIQTIFILLLIPLLPATKFSALVGVLLAIFSLGYMTYAYKTIFEQTWLYGVLKTIAVYLFGQTLYSLFSILIMSILLLLM